MSIIFVDDLPFQDAARRMLCMDEGVKAKPYKDTAGKTTIGVGRNLDDVGLNEEEIRTLLDNDIIRARDAVHRIYGLEFYETIGPIRQLALLNLAFNLGEKGLSEFHETNALIKERKWEEAAERLLTKTKYGRDLPQRAERVAIMLTKEDYPYQ